MLKRIKRIKSHVGHARFLSECSDLDLGWIGKQADIPSRYAYSPTHTVYDWQGIPVVLIETAHKTYDVFKVPEQMIRTLEQEAQSNYFESLELTRA